MAISIRNKRVERKVRELAALEGNSLTAAIEAALDQRLALHPKPGPRPTIEEMRAATDRFRKAVGLDKVSVKPMTKKDWDALWPTGIAEIDDT